MRDSVTTTDRFVFFWDGWPSQWHPTRFTVSDVQYTCAEQFMMAEKARVFNDLATLERIMATTSPREQKSLGRKVKNFDTDTWNSVCRGIVYTGNLAKFSQDPALRGVLLSTGDRTIVEASPFDAIWGIGLHADDPRAHDPAQWLGVNWLGVAIMQVRDQLAGNASLDPDLAAQFQARSSLGVA